MNLNKRPIAVDLFAGAGGMSLGFEQAGFNVATTIELDPIHCATHEYNFPTTKVICADISNISGEFIREKSIFKNSKIDVVFGGPPCQGFSMIGKRSLDDPRNLLIFHFIRIVSELKPNFFVMENVKGLTIGKQRQLLNELIEFACDSGFVVEKKYQVLNAADYGVPQDRKRLFLLGCKKGLTLPRYPVKKKLPAGSNGETKKLFEGLPSGPSSWDAICDLPEADNYPELLERDWVFAEYGKPSPYSNFLREINTIESDKSNVRIFDKKKLTSSLRTEHTAISRERFTKTEHGKIEPVSRFFKIDPNRVCNTLRAGSNNDKGAFTAPRPIHPYSPRCITVREAARLHSYPDWFRFHVTKWHGFRQVGNSVPPLLAKEIAEQIITVIGLDISKPLNKIRLENEQLLSLTLTQAAERYGIDPNVVGKRKRINKGD